MQTIDLHTNVENVKLCHSSSLDSLSLTLFIVMLGNIDFQYQGG